MVLINELRVMLVPPARRPSVRQHWYSLVQISRSTTGVLSPPPARGATRVVWGYLSIFPPKHHHSHFEKFHVLCSTPTHPVVSLVSLASRIY